ncbi:YveK family protein [Galactobacillus timonensis]|uniref:YveK family protein n=1 Tax=Galactobacillus timonensis TaxID=2041840 RepID=UPI000C842777|nr:Wzz/FepE/Etk N-terminal domain-containing protein [Galactobacillus timonensis]
MNNENTNQTTQDTFDLLDLLRQIKKYFWLLLLFVICMGAAGYFYSTYFIVPQYESSIMMIVNTRENNNSNVTNDNIISAQNLVSTYAVIIKSNTVLDRVIDDLNLNIEYDDLNENVYVDAVDDTQVMRVAVRNENKDLSAEIVDDIAEVAPNIIVDAVEAGSCKVISHVKTSDDPVTPNVEKNTLLMGALGLLIAIIAIVIRSLFTVRKIVDDNDAQKYIGLPVLGVIPELGGGNK